MVTRRDLSRATIGMVAALVLAVCISAVGATGATPSTLTDQAFWALVTDASEPGGSFRSDNLLSNELRLQYIIPELLRTVPRGRAYIGVGPE